MLPVVRDVRLAEGLTDALAQGTGRDGGLGEGGFGQAG